MTLREAVGYTLDLTTPFLPAQYLHHPLTASYVGLVQAIAPFCGLFVEPHLSGKYLPDANFALPDLAPRRRRPLVTIN